jgi:hypothetical protein
MEHKKLWIRLRRISLLLRLLVALISHMLATAGACLLLLYGRHLGQTIPIIRPVISPLIPVIRVIELPRFTGTTIVALMFPLTCRGKCGLHGISQCVTISDLDCLSQCGQHIPLESLPQHGAMSAPLSKPHDDLRLFNSFTGIAHHVPPSEVVMVYLIISLSAVS